MNANDRLNSVAEHFNTFTSVISTAIIKILLTVKLTII